MADGSIVINIDADDKQAQAELNRLTKKVDTLNDKIYIKQQQRMPLAKQAEDLGVQLDAAKAKLAEMQSGSSFETTSAIQGQVETVKALQKEWDGVMNQLDRMDNSISKDNLELDLSKERAGALQKKLNDAAEAAKGLNPPLAEGAGLMYKLVKRVQGLMRRVFVFTLITAALRAMKEWMGKVVKTNAEASAAIGRLKGALLTLVQPLVGVIIPAFTLFVNILTRVVNFLSGIVSSVFGTTAEKSAEAAKALDKQTKALDKTGASAKKAGKSMASFDTINQLSSNSDGGGGGGAGGGIAADFKGMVSDQLSSIAELFVGVALMAIGAILVFTGAHILIGLALMALGAAAIVDSLASNPDLVASMVKSGLDTILMIVGPMIAVLGVILAVTGHLIFGIAMIIAGIGIFHVGNAMGSDDFIGTLKSNLTNALRSIGVMIAVVGVLLAVTGHVVAGLGLIVAGIAAFGVAAAMDDNGASMKDRIMTGLRTVTKGIGLLVGIIGLILLVTGHFLPGLACLVAGIALFNASAVLDDNGASITEKVTSALNTTLVGIGVLIAVIGLILLFVPGMQAFGFGMIIAGIVAFGIGAVALDWGVILQKLKSAWADIQAWFKTSVKPYFSMSYWLGLGKDMMNGLISAVESGLNWIIDKLNDFITAVNSKTELLSFLGVPQIPTLNRVTIPRLAKGAVIPPNREFMAVLGDQKQGTNIETPLATMVQAFKQALAESGYGGGNEAYLMLDRDVLGKVVYRLNQEEGNRVGVSLTGV